MREANDSVFDLLGYDRDAIDDQTINDFFDPTGKGLFDRIKGELSKKDIYVFESNIAKVNTTIISGYFTCTKLFNRFGEFDGYLISVKDITEQKAQEQMILQAIISTQQQEQKRVADVLHDSLGQELSMAKLMISNMTKFKEGNDELTKLIDVCEEILDGSVAHLREICYDLMPSVLLKGGLQLAISDLVHRLETQDAIKPSFNISENFPRLVPDLEIIVFRIVQEFINNMIKYSEAAELDILIEEQKNNMFMVKLSENGQGFDVKILDKIGENRGYANIRSNVNAYTGTFNLESSKKGTILTLSFPKTDLNEKD